MSNVTSTNPVGRSELSGNPAIRRLRNTAPRLTQRRDPDWPGHLEAVIEVACIDGQGPVNVDVTLSADFGDGNIRRLDTVPSIPTYVAICEDEALRAHSVHIGVSSVVLALTLQ